MNQMLKWLVNYERQRHSKEPNEFWISSKYDIQGLHWQELQQIYLPELKMCWGPACNSLRKLWKSYKIAGQNGEPRGDIAWRINKIQSAMGIEKSEFPELEGIGRELTDEEIQLRREERANGTTLILRLARKCPNLIQRNGLRKMSNYGGKSYRLNGRTTIGGSAD
jgi:hypothetical protein